MKTFNLIFTVIVLIAVTVSMQAQDDHDHDHDKNEEHETHENEGGVSFTPQQLAIANIRVSELQPRRLDYQLYTPGEIKANGYTSYVVSPRVDSVVVRRHVALGDHVEVGQSLVTLFSEVVADAQATWRIANSEWERVKQLGRTVVGDKRYVSAEAEFNAATARLQAFGLSNAAIQLNSTNQNALGEYTLVASSNGVVRSDDFHQGQRIQAGETLMDLADEHQLWVEARLAPTTNIELPAGTAASVQVGPQTYPATVAQEAHTIDPITRTRVVRLLVENEQHRLHPGLFADVFFTFTTDAPVFAVPESALMRGADGDWVVFIEHETNEFKPVEIELGRPLGEWREISGIEPGTRVVMEGAFFVASEIAKGGFDPHNH